MAEKNIKLDNVSAIHAAIDLLLATAQSERDAGKKASSVDVKIESPGQAEISACMFQPRENQAIITIVFTNTNLLVRAFPRGGINVTKPAS